MANSDYHIIYFLNMVNGCLKWLNWLTWIGLVRCF